MSPRTTETENLERTPLLDSRHSGKNSLTCYSLKGARHHSPDSSMNSQLESGPSCLRSPIYKRSFSSATETLLSSSSSPDKESESSERTSTDSPSFECIYPQQSQSVLSISGSFCNVQNWVELRLENSGSVARDHLASERTFLAYTRTSLAIASSGVALVFSTTSAASWQKLHIYIRILGASTVIVGLLVLFIGFTRYFTIQVALTKGVFPVARLAIGFVAMMLGVLVTLTFGILLAGKLEQE